MTTPRYPKGCAAGSQVRGIASPSDYAINVNLDNGNVNWNNQNNEGLVVACRRVPARECQDAVGLRELLRAKREARRSKVPSVDMVSFETRWIDGVLGIQDRLNAGTWEPSPTTCFIAQNPKAREIHAPTFADRVVHHWLVPQLEAIYEPLFIHDSFANRARKGTHAAVKRLESFVREVHSGQGGGYYLQLDIRNFFNSLPRRILYRLLKTQMQKAGLRVAAKRVVHALLKRHPLKYGVIQKATPAERAAVPPYKRLENSGEHCGLPIGNLSSQFFANVLLNELDQFVKHVLKAKRYLRYVDDFVLVHHSREQLAQWQVQIERFLAEKLELRLKDDIRLRPLSAGIDFLGYVVLPTHTRVRRRVVSHARAALADWQRAHIRDGVCTVRPADYRVLSAKWASYGGHFEHASSFRLRQDFHLRFPWLQQLTAKRRFFPRDDEQRFSIHVGKTKHDHS